MNVLAGCITAASAALVEAGIDCLDLVSGGVAALTTDTRARKPEIVVDPNFAEHTQTLAVCCVGYLSSRDELVELWMQGDVPHGFETKLCDQAVAAAQSSRTVLAEVLKENAASKVGKQKKLQQANASILTNG